MPLFNTVHSIQHYIVCIQEKQMCYIQQVFRPTWVAYICLLHACMKRQCDFCQTQKRITLLFPYTDTVRDETLLTSSWRIVWEFCKCKWFGVLKAQTSKYNLAEAGVHSARFACRISVVVWCLHSKSLVTWMYACHTVFLIILAWWSKLWVEIKHSIYVFTTHIKYPKLYVY